EAEEQILSPRGGDGAGSIVRVEPRLERAVAIPDAHRRASSRDQADVVWDVREVDPRVARQRGVLAEEFAPDGGQNAARPPLIGLVAPVPGQRVRLGASQNREADD